MQTHINKKKPQTDTNISTRPCRDMKIKCSLPLPNGEKKTIKPQEVNEHRILLEGTTRKKGTTGTCEYIEVFINF